MVVIVSAIMIFIFLCLSAILAMAAPIKQPNTKDEQQYKTNSVLLTLVQHSKNVPAIVDVIGW